MRARLLIPLILVLFTAALGGACSSGGAGPANPIRCAGDGALCSSDTECCSVRCVGGVCGGGIYACLETNVSCISSPQCCSQVCTQDGFCALQGSAGTCKPLTAACGDDTECCSNNCNVETNACVVGQACNDDFVSCMTSLDCCSKSCNTTTLTCQPVACTPAGEVCTADHQCCDGNYCDPSGGVCAACVQTGGPCMVAADCCSGTCSGNETAGTCM
jgi:hypothetical protein